MVIALGAVALLSLVKIYVLIRCAIFEWTRGAEYLDRLRALPISLQSDLREHFLIRDALGGGFRPLGIYTYGFWRKVIRPTLSSRSPWSLSLETLFRLTLSIYIITPIGFALLIAQSSRFAFGERLPDEDWWAGLACVLSLLLLQLASAVESSVGQLALGDLAADYVGYRTGIKDPLTRMLDRAAAFVGSLLFFFLSATAALTWGASRTPGFPYMPPPEISQSDWLLGMGNAMYTALLLILGLQNIEASNIAARSIVSLILITGASFLVAALGILWGSLQSQSDAIRSTLTAATGASPPPHNCQTSPPPPTSRERRRASTLVVMVGVMGAVWFGYSVGLLRQRVERRIQR